MIIISLSITLYFFSVGEFVSSIVSISGPFCYCEDPSRTSVFEPLYDPCNINPSICKINCGFSYYDFNKASGFEDNFRKILYDT